MANPDCPRCNGTGGIVEAGYVTPCPCHADEVRRRTASRCGLRFAQLDSRLGLFDISSNPSRPRALEAINGILDWVTTAGAPRPERPFIFLSGANGRGKSYLCEALVNEAALRAGFAGDRGRLIYFITESDLNGILQEAIREPELRGHPETIIHELNLWGGVVIDDAGTQAYGEWFQGMLWRFLEDRILDRRPIIVTSNYDLCRGEDAWLPRCLPNHKSLLLDRFYQVGVEIELGGRSWRREPVGG